MDKISFDGTRRHIWAATSCGKDKGNQVPEFLFDDEINSISRVNENVVSRINSV